MENFNPVLFNCVLLYFTVILLSLVQSRFRIFKDDPWVFILLLILTPIFVLGKTKNIKTWTGITGAEIWGWTINLSCSSNRNELFISYIRFADSKAALKAFIL